MSYRSSLFFAQKVYYTVQCFYNSEFDNTVLKKTGNDSVFDYYDYQNLFFGYPVFNTTQMDCHISLDFSFMTFNSYSTGYMSLDSVVRLNSSKIVPIHSSEDYDFFSNYYTENELFVCTVFSYLILNKCKPFYLDLRII